MDTDNLSEVTDFLLQATNPEPLDPELEAYMGQSSIGMSIRHPLVYSVIHHPAMNAFVNAQLEQKQRAVRNAYENEDWHRYVWLHERPYRAEAFFNVMDYITDDSEYWGLLGEVWIDSENIRQNPRLWKRLLSSNRAGVLEMMNRDEREALGDMPVAITVYQGHTTSRDDGWSWTIDRDKAVWFAQRFAALETGMPMVTTGCVFHHHVKAYFTRRGESEILVDRRLVINRSFEHLELEG
jgi:hypothetical protein